MNTPNYTNTPQLYDTFSLPIPPSPISEIAKKSNYPQTSDYIYIGRGTNPSIADTYNNGITFESAFISDKDIRSFPTTNKPNLVHFDFIDGSCEEFHYFVPKDSTLLPKMFPLNLPNIYSVSHIFKSPFKESLLKEFNLVYIGKGTVPSISETYNNSKTFQAYQINSNRISPNVSSQEFKELLGQLTYLLGTADDYHYFLPKDSPILPNILKNERATLQILQTKHHIDSVIKNLSGLELHEFTTELLDYISNLNHNKRTCEEQDLLL